MTERMGEPALDKSTTGAEPVWVLMGSKHGDNSQMLALAGALGLPFRTIALHFNGLHWLPPTLLGASVAYIQNKSLLCAPWPQLVISSGRRSVAAARWVRRQAGGDCRLVHIGRPWGPLKWFDLIVTTPQYALPHDANIRHNLLPLTSPTTKAVVSCPALPANVTNLPRPWTMVALGGNSRPLVLSKNTVIEMAKTLDAEQAERGGSLMIVASPRTPKGHLEAMRPFMRGSHALFAWKKSSNIYQALRLQADRFVVTSDSVQMATELVLSGQPVQIFPLPERPDILVRLVRAWRDAASRKTWLRPTFNWAQSRGLLASLRDINLFHDQLASINAYDDPSCAIRLAENERQQTVERVQQLIKKPSHCGVTD